MISIILPVYNDEKFIGEAIEFILKQSYTDFELIVYDDCSTDNSLKVINQYKDSRIKVLVNRHNIGIAKIRNQGIGEAKGEYIFFTDSDCVADKDWLKNGLETFRQNDCLGVEGKTYYNFKNYMKTPSDKLPGDVDGARLYLGCNIAFTREIMVRLHGYDERYLYHADREFALRVLEIGKIAITREMIITHQKKLWSVMSYIRSGKRASDRVLLFKDHNDRRRVTFRLLFINNLVKILFPPLLIYTLIHNKPKTYLDYKIIFASYPKHIYERCCIWKAAIRERIFII